MKGKLTIEELQQIARTKAFFTPVQVSGVLGCNPYLINVQSKKNPEALGFPVIRVGNRVKIPAAAFLAYMGAGRWQLS